MCEYLSDHTSHYLWTIFHKHIKQSFTILCFDTISKGFVPGCVNDWWLMTLQRYDWNKRSESINQEPWNLLQLKSCCDSLCLKLRSKNYGRKTLYAFQVHLNDKDSFDSILLKYQIDDKNFRSTRNRHDQLSLEIAASKVQETHVEIGQVASVWVVKKRTVIMAPLVSALIKLPGSSWVAISSGNAKSSTPI